MLLDLGCAVASHQDGEHRDRVNLVLLAGEREDRERPHRLAMAADAGPSGEQGEGERHILGMEEIASGLLDRGPERNGRGERDRQPR